jgi:hypothetical protein
VYHDTLMSFRLPPDSTWSAAQNEGALIAFFPSEIRRAVDTAHGTKDAVNCRKVVNLDTGEVFHDVLVFGAALTVNIREGVPDNAVLGRLTKGARGAWFLAPHTPEELAQAHNWMTENPE